MTTRRDIKYFDPWLFCAVLLLACFGILMIASATGVGTGMQTEIQVKVYKSQYMWVTTGVLIMLVAAFVDYDWIGTLWPFVYGFNLLLLITVLLIGTDDGSASRWIMLKDLGIPISFGIQPSEFTKIFMIIYLSKLIDKYQEKINNIGILSLLLLLSLFPIFLIFIQPSLSASLVPLVILCTLLYGGKIYYRYIILAAFIIGGLLFFIYYDLHRQPHLLLDKILEGYQIKRLWAFFNPEATNPDLVYQTKQSIIAIGSGQLSGKGLFGNNVHVPYAYNDFIFSIVGAEFGFVGAVSVVGVMGFIVAKCFLIARRAVSLFGRLICMGVGVMLAFHCVVNVLVATGKLPNTGITFPFISSGGSSMWILMASVGLVLNVGMTREKPMFER